MSSIKQKHGQCLDCPAGSKDKPLTAKRCQFHYWNYRASLKPVKVKEIGKSDWKEAKRKEMNAFLGKAKTEPKPKKAIPKRSKKKIVEDLQYSVLRKEFLGKPENRICPITGEEATTIHHKKGRLGDLYLDTRYWIALSMRGHETVENSPQWAKEMGYSLSRLETTE